MNVDERNILLKDFFVDCMGILVKKGKDYNPNGVAFDEIRAEADSLGLKPEQYMLVLMSKHWGAIKRHARTGRTESEDIRSRCMDLANYAAMYATMVRDGEIREKEKSKGRKR